MRIQPGTWVIMNAGKWISGKPSIKRIIKENGHTGIITVAKKDGKDIFILGSGDSAYGDNGSIHTFVLDTGNGYRGGGRVEVINSIVIGKDAIINPGNGIGVDDRRTLYVFK